MSEQQALHSSLGPGRPLEPVRGEVKESSVFTVLLAIVMALPAIGMISGGFTTGSYEIGWWGVGIFVGMGIVYFIIASLTFANQDLAGMGPEVHADAAAD